MKTEIFNFKVIIYKDTEEDIFVAHCLELDLVAASDKLNQLTIDMSDIILCQLRYSLENDNLEHLFFPASLETWKLFFNCHDRTINTRQDYLPIEIDDVSFTPNIRLEICFVD